MKFGATVIVMGLVVGALGFLITTWERWLAVGFGATLVSLGLDLLLSLLPNSRPREIARTVIEIPAALFIVLVTAGSAVLNIGMSLGLLFMFLLLSSGLASHLLVPSSSAGPAQAYFALLATIAIAAYAGDRVLWPVKWMYYIGRGPHDKVAREGLHHSTLIIRLVNFRRLAYLIAIGVYAASVMVALAEIKLSATWQSAVFVSREALLAFLALDAYVAAFHGNLLKDRPPIAYEFKQWPWDRWRMRSDG
jgi:hypothetical protein